MTPPTKKIERQCNIENCKGEHCTCCGVHIRLDPNEEDV